MGMGFRQALQWTVAAREAEIALMAKQRGIMRRICDGTVRLMSAGWNKLLEAHKARNNMLKETLRFVIKTLTDKDAAFTLMAYNQMKQRMLMLNGVGLGDSEMKKSQLIKRLTNQGYNLQVMGINCIREFLTSARNDEERAREEYERQQKEKDRILRRIMNTNVRFMGMGFRQALQWTVAAREAEIALMAKQRGIMRRIVDSNVRLMSAGWNKLLEAHKARNGMLKEKLRFVIKALTDKDAMFTLMAYNAMKQRMQMLNGVGMGGSEKMKCQLIKRLTNQGYNLQVMAVNCIREFMTSARADEEEARLQAERDLKEKDRILRMMGTGFRQALQWTITDREAEIALMAKQRGIMRRIVDSNVRLMSAGWNKLLEEWKNRNGMLKDKLRFVIKTLTDKDAAFTLMAYNQMKQRKLALEGVGFGDDVATKLKIRLLRKLTDMGFNLQVMGVNAVKEFLTSEREREEADRLEFERQQKEKDRILRRIMNTSVRFMGMGFRQALQWTVAAREAEIALFAKQRGIMRRIVDSNVRLMSAGWNKLMEEWKNKQGALKEKLRF